MNKPKALNALDLDMIRTMYKYIKSIDNSNTIKTVWLEGAGEVNKYNYINDKALIKKIFYLI